MFCFNVYVVRYIFVNMCVLIKKINVLANSLIVSYAHQILHNTEQENDYSLNEHAIIRRRTGNGMTTIIKTTRQTMIHKILHRKLTYTLKQNISSWRLSHAVENFCNTLFKCNHI
jgi:hypothetical protein